MASNNGLRFVVVFVALLLALLAAWVFVMAAGLIGVPSLDPSWPLAQSATSWAIELITEYRWRTLFGAALVGLMAFALLLRVMRPPHRATDLHMLVADEQGFVVVDSQGIVTVAEQAAEGAYGVVNSTVQVRGNGPSPIRLRAEVGVFPGADIKRAGSEARESVRTAVEKLVGLPVQDVTVAVRVLEPSELAEMMA